MTTLSHKPRIAIVSPFIDRSFGTERFVVEWVSRLADTFEFHVYSQRIKDVDLKTMVWHRIPKLPGPHILNFAWWFLANHLWRFCDRLFHRVHPDLVFSPGVNCMDGDVVSVHIVFADYAQKNKDGISFSRNPISSWPRLLHRKLYYTLIIFLEKRIYTRRDIKLVPTAKRTFEQLKRLYQVRGFCPVLYTGIEHHRFNPRLRANLRESAREALGLEPASFALLLIGNDWRNKGLPALCEVLSLLPDLPVHLLVVSREDSRGAQRLLGDPSLKSRIHFLPTRADVEFYYSAADAYAGPSLEDTFALPPAEAMACGLPVIVSAEMGAAEIITHEVDGMILQDPKDAAKLAQMIRRLVLDPEFRQRLGDNAARTARQYTWERNARELEAILFEALREKGLLTQQTAAERL